MSEEAKRDAVCGERALAGREQHREARNMKLLYFIICFFCTLNF